MFKRNREGIPDSPSTDETGQPSAKRQRTNVLSSSTTSSPETVFSSPSSPAPEIGSETVFSSPSFPSLPSTEEEPGIASMEEELGVDPMEEEPGITPMNQELEVAPMEQPPVLLSPSFPSPATLEEWAKGKEEEESEEENEEPESEEEEGEEWNLEDMVQWEPEEENEEDEGPSSLFPSLATLEEWAKGKEEEEEPEEENEEPESEEEEGEEWNLEDIVQWEPEEIRKLPPATRAEIVQSLKSEEALALLQEAKGGSSQGTLALVELEDGRHYMIEQETSSKIKAFCEALGEIKYIPQRRKGGFHAEMRLIRYADDNGLQLDEANIWVSKAICPDCEDYLEERGVRIRTSTEREEGIEEGRHRWIDPYTLQSRETEVLNPATVFRGQRSEEVRLLAELSQTEREMAAPEQGRSLRPRPKK